MLTMKHITILKIQLNLDKPIDLYLHSNLKKTPIQVVSMTRFIYVIGWLSHVFKPYQC